MVKRNFYSLLSKIFTTFLHLLKILQQNRWLSIAINGVLLIVMCVFVMNYLFKEWNVIKESSIHISYPPFFTALTIYGLNYIIFMVCWQILVKAYGIPSSFITNILNYSYSQVAKILPTPAWFITGRIVMYTKDGVRNRTVLTATGMEIVLHMAVGTVFFLLAEINIYTPFTWLYGLSIIPLILLVIFPSKLNFRFLELKDFSLSHVEIFLMIVLFSLTWILSIPFFQLILNGVGVPNSVSLIELFQIWILSSLLAYIGSLTLGGIGVLREFSLTLMLSGKMAPTAAVAIATVSRIIMTLGNIIWPFIIIGLINLNKVIATSNSDDNKMN